MAGVRRRLREVGKTLSGVLGVGPGEPDEQPVPSVTPTGHDEQQEQQVQVEDSVPETTPEPAVKPVTEPAAEPAVEPLAEPPVEPLADLPAEPVTEPPVEPVADPLLAEAVELARAAAVEVGGDSVGAHLGVVAEPGGGPAATHSFATTDKAYVGWRWSVAVARADGSRHVTVDEVVLLPGEGALLAPAWLPWAERVRPGDLSAGELLPPAVDDGRLVPAYAEPDELVDDVGWELGLGRPRVLSREGRLETAERWYDGSAGPDTPVARQAPGRCAGCGFLVPLAGSLRQAFGVCANAFAPDDGRVVALAHGCGAHSETVVAPVAVAALVAEPEDDLVPAEVP